MQPGLLVASMPVTLSGSARSLARSRGASTERRANKAKRNRAGAEQGGQVSTDLQEGKRASACHLSTHPCLEVWGQVQNQHRHQCSRLLCFLFLVFSLHSTAKLLLQNADTYLENRFAVKMRWGDETFLFVRATSLLYCRHKCLPKERGRGNGGGNNQTYPRESWLGFCPMGTNSKPWQRLLY